MTQLAASARHVPVALLIEADNRACNRYLCEQEAVTQALDASATMSWGATVKDISAGGMGIVLCFPFKPGSHLAVAIQAIEIRRTFLVRVVHVLDQSDGTWFLGCEFVRQLQDEEVERIRQAS
ncbi:MAG: PilZ domain-containing protein [Planctomycetes bacterium]|nr:PilZ domain-containing protein [Planctomycetota bacterium]